MNGVPKWSSEANDELTMGVFPVVNCQLTIFAASLAAVAPRRVDCQLGKKIVNWPPCSIEPMKTKLFCKSQNVQGRTKMEPRETPLDTVRWPCGSTWLCQVAESGPKPNPKSQIVVPWFPKCNQRLTKKDHELQKFPKMQPKVPKIEAGGVDLAPKGERNQVFHLTCCIAHLRRFPPPLIPDANGRKKPSISSDLLHRTPSQIPPFGSHVMEHVK